MALNPRISNPQLSILPPTQNLSHNEHYDIVIFLKRKLLDDEKFNFLKNFLQSERNYVSDYNIVHLIIYGWQDIQIWYKLHV